MKSAARARSRRPGRFVHPSEHPKLIEELCEKSGRVRRLLHGLDENRPGFCLHGPAVHGCANLKAPASG